MLSASSRIAFFPKPSLPSEEGFLLSGVPLLCPWRLLATTARRLSALPKRHDRHLLSHCPTSLSGCNLTSS